MAFVLRSDKLRMDEADILEKVTEWATVNSVSWFKLVSFIAQVDAQLCNTALIFAGGAGSQSWGDCHDSNRECAVPPTGP